MPPGRDPQWDAASVYQPFVSGHAATMMTNIG